jgi:Putative collagen-binding domain of a collagenase
MTGVSIQSLPTNVVALTRKWVTESAKSGHKWVVASDEQGTAGAGVVPDSYDFNHDSIRKFVLWGNLMNNGAGVEYYFGYDYPNSDMTCQDYRSRENMWKISKNALDFFRKYIPYWTMSIATSLLFNSTKTVNSCMATADKQTIVVYLRDGGNEVVNLSISSSSNFKSYTIDWYDPMSDNTTLQKGSVSSVAALSNRSIGSPPNADGSTLLNKDWVVLIRGSTTQVTI